jgi:hypothetical protein
MSRLDFLREQAVRVMGGPVWLLFASVMLVCSFR